MFLLRNCLCGGRLTQARDATHLLEGKFIGDADEQVRPEEHIAQGLYYMDASRPGMHPKLPSGLGSSGAMYSPYDVVEPRTVLISLPSFTLSTIAEDETDEEEGGADDITVYASSIPHAATRGSATASQPSDRSSGVSFVCEPFDSDSCGYAIIPPAYLSTVFEDTDGEESGDAPSGSCHSADAGYFSNRRTPHSNSSLIRGLSEPSCVSLAEAPDGVLASMANKPSAVADRTPPTASTAGTGTAGHLLKGVWYC